MIRPKLRTQLSQAYEHSALPEKDLRNYLATLQREIAQLLRSSLPDIDQSTIVTSSPRGSEES